VPLAPLPIHLSRIAGRPALVSGLGAASLVDRLKNNYSLFTKGQFTEALQQFRSLLQSILFVVATSPREEEELKELINICREYIVGLQMELKRKELVAAKAQPGRQVELAAYFTHCNLQLPHLVLTLRSAANCAFQNKNLVTAKVFATRLLELNPKPEVATMVFDIKLWCYDNFSYFCFFNRLRKFVVLPNKLQQRVSH